MSARWAALAMAVAVAGCAETDPLVRPGAWHPLGSNQTNLAAMVANPQDLIAGRGSDVTDGAIAADAVARYRAGKVHPLSDSSVSKVAPLAVLGAAAPASGDN